MQDAGSSVAASRRPGMQASRFSFIFQCLVTGRQPKFKVPDIAAETGMKTENRKYGPAPAPHRGPLAPTMRDRRL